MPRSGRPVKKSPARPIIGWREWVALPELGIDFIKVKVDTGARTSALHALDMEETLVDSRPHVRFKIHPAQRRSHPTVEVELPLIAHRRVRDSGGRTELRPVVETTLELMGERWPIELTLTRRDTMGFRMLLGRKAIRRRLIVDPGRSFLMGKGPSGGRSS